MTLDGNHVQIPNATVYKSNIHNYTSNPNRRADFLIGIGYEDSISKAQDIGLKMLENHPAILKDPDLWHLWIPRRVDCEPANLFLDQWGRIQLLQG